MNNMKEIIKKSLLVGLGTADTARAKAKKLIDGFVKKKILTKQDGKAIFEKLAKELEKQRDKLSKMSDEKIKGLAAKFNSIEKQLERKGRKVAKSLVKKAEKELKR